VLSEQRTTDLMIALADMQRERDAWRAEALASREQRAAGKEKSR
jgi:hypothetical protein